MKLEITKKTDNPLFKRTEVLFEIKHEKSEATPSRKQVIDVLAAKLGAKKELLVIGSIKSPMGKKASNGVAYLYKDKDTFDRLAWKYLKKRDIKEPKEKKAEAPKDTSEQAPSASSKAEGEEKLAEEQKEELKEEEKEEEKKEEVKEEEKKNE